jgi:hypothetical protein
MSKTKKSLRKFQIPNQKGKGLAPRIPSANKAVIQTTPAKSTSYSDANIPSATNMHNCFESMRKVVAKAFKQYADLRKRINWADAGKSKTIAHYAKPFLDGYFTLAIVGKMSAGKSTFINALIGENLLPTGHFQTTSGITWIISSNKRYMEVTFADGNKKKYTENLEQELKKLVAIPPQFHDLPINEINRCISGNCNIATILKQKPGIEKSTKTDSDESLWREYIKSMPKSKIAKNVEIYLPLPSEYTGWRIVDTPGVGAIGGIQDATKTLLTSQEDGNNVVDAVILLHSGAENIEDESANEFASQVNKSMGTLAKDRLFFVLTHGADPKFTTHQEGTLERANSLFCKRLQIPSDRLTFVDSLIHKFIVDAKNTKRDFSNRRMLNTPLAGWDEDEWKTFIKSAISPFYLQIEMSGMELSNATLFNELEKASNFQHLNYILNLFLENEKARSCEKVLSLIRDELKSYNSQLSDEIKGVSNGQAEIDKQIKAAEKDSQRLSLELVKLQQKSSKGAIENQFKFIDEELQTLSSLSTIGEVRTKYLEIIKKGERTEKKLFSELIKEYSSNVEKFENRSTTFESLDLDDIDRVAGDLATKAEPDKSRPVQKLVKEGGLSSDAEYVTTYPFTRNSTDVDKKRREFTALVLKRGRVANEAFQNGVRTKMDIFFKLADSSIKEKTSKTKERLNSYKENLDKKDSLLSNLQKCKAEVNTQLEELNKFWD